MADDTTTSVTGGQDPIYTTAVTSTIGRPPRRMYFTIQMIALAATLGVCWISRTYVRGYGQADIKDFSRITTLLMRLGELLMTPIGFACAVFIVVGLGLLAIKGVIDGFLKFLIWANVLWLIAFLAFSTMSIWMPLLQARKNLAQ